MLTDPHTGGYSPPRPIETCPLHALHKILGWIATPSDTFSGTELGVKYGAESGHWVTCMYLENGKWVNMATGDSRAAPTHWLPLPSNPNRVPPRPDAFDRSAN